MSTIQDELQQIAARGRTPEKRHLAASALAALAQVFPPDVGYDVCPRCRGQEARLERGNWRRGTPDEVCNLCGGWKTIRRSAR